MRRIATRSTLIERVGGRRVVVIDAPLGAGKSTVAEQLADRWGGAIARVVVREGDEPAALADRLARAVRRCGVDVADPIGARWAIDDVLSDIARAPSPVTLLIDDAHLLTDDDRTSVAEALADLPAPHRVVLAGRRLRLDRLVTRSGILALGSADLALDADDVRELLGDLANPALVAEILAATDGWTAAAAAAAERVRADPRWSPSSELAMRSMIGDLLADLGATDPTAAVLSRLPLLDDAILRDVAETLGTVGDGRAGLPLRDIGRWLAMPPAVAAVLRRPDPLPLPLVERTVQRYLDFGEPAAALRLVIGTATPADAAQLVGHVPWTVFADLDVRDVRELVAHVRSAPAELAWPVILNAARAVEATDGPARGAWLDLAAERAAEAGDEVGARAVAAELARYRLRSGDITSGVALAERVLAEAGPDEPVARARAAVSLAMAAVVENTPASLARAARLYRSADELFAAAGETRWRADMLARFGYTALFLAGRPVEGARAMEDALALLPVGDLTRAYWLTFAADLLDFVGRTADAEAALREAIEIGTRRRDPATIGAAWWSMSWLAAHRGDRSATREALAVVEAHRGEWMQAGQAIEYLTSSAEYLLSVGDVAGYHEFIELGAQAAESLDYPEPVEIARSWFDATHGDPAAALRVLEDTSDTRAAMRAYRPRRLLLVAIAHLRLGDVERASAVAAEAFADAAELGVPDLHQRQNAGLLQMLAPVLADRATAPVAVRIQLLGGFSVAVGPELRTPPPGHPATLVKLLAVRGPLATDVVLDTLWPEADLATGRTRLRNLLNRLKERSGSIVLRTGESLHLSPDAEVDLTLFERAAEAALTAAPDERVGRARRALALHTGELLPADLYEDWTTAPRARAQRLLLALADLVANDAEARGDLDEAIVLLDLGLVAEPLDEARTLRICALLTRQGRRGAAAAAAVRCRDLLAELGVTPTLELATYASG